MREFFSGWKQKCGIFTLALGCVFLAGWVRSLQSHNWIRFRSDENRVLVISSARSQLLLVRIPDYWGELFIDLSTDVINAFKFDRTPSAENNKPWIFGEFAVGRNAILGGAPIDVVIVPYWSLVMPLTAISAGLLLSRPRSPKPEIIPKSDVRQ